jgi:dihydroorotase
MAENPRKLLGLDVPAVKTGEKADFILVDTETEWKVDPAKLHSKSHNTVFKGESFKGRNIMTVTDGIIRYEFI